MVNYSLERLDSVFSALADPTRRALLERLARGEASVTELAAPFQISLPAISRHLRILERAGLVRRERDGRIHHMRLTAAPLKEAAQWIAHYERIWEAQFDNLATYLESGTEEAQARDTDDPSKS
ncbi:MAG TPA: metalloregulator ArsR/SmtB family transcription factor [Aggregatilineales bacterium]|nr:metalloregulator ArsR/SmtB family transcription factor [Aggregatilineales bacterium]